ncbi:OmpW family protein [Janthinobacterium sp. GW460P]|uniref:OmpW/AlkL family protein n=1 Tax=unclassified Janthinobacterium TaxID=2610881 RepID=UPI000A32023C|nr:MULTISPECIES: OmpW family outer membrane protein [unclassified Janthinobacterium]MCC7702355.1 OmpW family protein [Janthinobacterium sp. GW460P]MCC7707863.1 OmpW family protein [Janthinobacterium sp. GW460W]
MKNRLNTAARVLAAAAAMAMATGASAQSAGTWTAKVGINKITPHVDSGDISAPALPGTKADVKADTKPILTFAYMVTDNISAELDLGVPYKHDLIGDGAIKGTGKLGTAEVLPPTAFIQYRFFQPNAMIRPYVGAGLTYAYFQKEKGSGQMTALLDPGGQPVKYRLDNKLAGSLQIGSTLAFNERWFADVAVVKTFLKTKAKFSTGQTQDITLDPIAVSIGIGYKF